MSRWIHAKSAGMWGVGLAMGLLIGAGLVLGFMRAGGGSAPAVVWPATPLHAVATDSGNSFAIATGPIDENLEGLFTLDFLTGELRCSVLNPRTGQLGAAYGRNVAGDLGVERGKKPQYLLVTGTADFRGNTGNVRPAQSIVYVADANTGRFAAYMLPYNRSMAATNYRQGGQMVLIGTGSARDAVIRE